LAICKSLNPVAVLVCVLAGFAFQPFALTIEKGQFGALLLLLWSSGTLFAERKKDVLSALMFALATIIKLTPVMAVGIFLLRRRWKWAAAYSLWMALMIGAGVWKLGLENHRLYVQTVRSLSCGVPGPYNYSLTGIFQNIYYGNVLSYEQMPAETPKGLCTFTKIAGIGLYLGALFVLCRRNPYADIVFDLVVLCLLTLLLAPFTWRHYYVLELLPLIFVWLSQGNSFQREKWVLGVLSVCTITAATRYPDYLQIHLANEPLRVLLVALLPLSALLLTATLLFSWQSVATPELRTL
jgi:general stress protein CsbA